MKIKYGALLAFTLSGCAGLPSQEEAARADYGSYPSSYESVVKKYFEYTLKDPDSVQYRGITSPKKWWLGNRIDGAKYGYLVCATSNAKNSFGAYTGYSTDALLIRNDTVIQFVSKGDWWGKPLCS
jgi:hypothetical protein